MNQKEMETQWKKIVKNLHKKFSSEVDKDFEDIKNMILDISRQEKLL